MLIFFGDPETKGEVGDAEACLRMAWEMQHRLRELNIAWRNSGVEQPFQARIGINSGYCNVGNFGSADRMDYTIIGAEANLAARLQSVAEPGRIVLSYETYALVRQLVTARPLAPITMKGISREVVPYAVERLVDAEDLDLQVVAEETSGLSLYLDPGAITRATSRRSRIRSAAHWRRWSRGGACSSAQMKKAAVRCRTAADDGRLRCVRLFAGQAGAIGLKDTMPVWRRAHKRARRCPGSGTGAAAGCCFRGIGGFADPAGEAGCRNARRETFRAELAFKART